MKRAYRNAFNALKKIGAPVYERSDIENFQISAEGIYGDYDRDTIWADYYDGRNIPDWEFGVNPLITNILRKYDLHAEWINAGELGVYEN
jgi:hypothetical protein